MEPSVSANETQDIPVATGHSMCANEHDNLLSYTEIGETIYIGTMTIGVAKRQSSSELFIQLHYH